MKGWYEPIGITDPFGDTTRYVYDAAGRRIETQSAGSALSTLLAYETITGRLSGVTSLRSTDGSPAVARAYPLYDHAGNRLQVTGAAGATDYSYDVLHRLKSADPPNAEVTHYDYDAAGNRQQAGRKLGDDFVPPFQTYDYLTGENPLDPTHKLSVVRDHNEDPVHQFGAYDPNGNPGTWFRAGEGTRTLTWDALDRLVAISDSYEASYVYDPLGRRIEKTEAGTTTLYQYDGLDVVAEYSAAHALQATYVFGPGIDEPIKARRGNKVASYHSDGLGSILAVARTKTLGADFASYSYGPFGEDEGTIQSPVFPNAYTYTGRERDGSGLYYYRARYYLAEVGRFLTPDPIGLRGGINPYAYVGSNPINFTDPFGLLPKNSYSNLASPLAGTVSQGGGGALSSLAGAGAGVFVGVNAAPYVSAAAAACPLCAVGAGVVGVGALAYDAYQGFPATRSFFNSVGDTFKGQATFTEAFDTGIVFGGLGGAGLAARGASTSSALIPRSFETLAPNGGRLGGFSTTEALRPGTLLDRFGPNTGRFVSPAGTPFSARGLPPEAALERFQTFEVLQGLNVEGSIASPAFGGGLGVQYRLPATVQELIDAGVLGVK